MALAEAEEARAALRDRWAETASDARAGPIVEAAIPLVERQLELVRHASRRSTSFADDLTEKMRSLRRRQTQLRRTQPRTGRPR